MKGKNDGIAPNVFHVVSALEAKNTTLPLPTGLLTTAASVVPSSFLYLKIVSTPPPCGTPSLKYCVVCTLEKPTGVPLFAASPNGCSTGCVNPSGSNATPFACCSVVCICTGCPIVAGNSFAPASP